MILPCGPYEQDGQPLLACTGISSIKKGETATRTRAGFEAILPTLLQSTGWRRTKRYP